MNNSFYRAILATLFISLAAALGYVGTALAVSAVYKGPKAWLPGTAPSRSTTPASTALNADGAFFYEPPAGQLHRGVEPAAVLAYDAAGRLLDRIAVR
jgi:hypothetical protein